MIPNTPPPPVGAQMQAAIALGREAHRRGQEAILPEIQATGTPSHLLIEGQLKGSFVQVAMPDGARWIYHHSLPQNDGATLLLHIDMSSPQIARLFHPTAEGIHPYLGEAIRFGVERKVA